MVAETHRGLQCNFGTSGALRIGSSEAMGPLPASKCGRHVELSEMSKLFMKD